LRRFGKKRYGKGFGEVGGGRPPVRGTKTDIKKCRQGGGEGGKKAARNL